MSSEIDLNGHAHAQEIDEALDELEESGDDVPPGAFYLALKNALVQLANQPTELLLHLGAEPGELGHRRRDHPLPRIVFGTAHEQPLTVVVRQQV